MTRDKRSSDHARNTVRKLLTVGERLPDKTRRDILALKDAAIAPLLDVLGDDGLAMMSAPGRGYAPVHAVWLLTELRAESAIASMLDVLAETEWDTILHDAIIQALPRFGAAVLEPTLRAYADGRYSECRDSLASILAALRIRDDRILAVLCDQLALDPELGASDLAEYGDLRALDDLVRAYDRYQIHRGCGPNSDWWTRTRRTIRRRSPTNAWPASGRPAQISSGPSPTGSKLV